MMNTPKISILVPVYNVEKYLQRCVDSVLAQDFTGLPCDDLGEKMEAVEEALRKAMEKKDKLAILTGVYTGGGEKVWVFYTRTVRVFGERLNEALAPFELLPISIYTEMDPDWEEYKDMYEMKEWAVD